MSSKTIELYKTLSKDFTKPQFNEVCLYLREEHGYDLSYVDLDKAPSESANQLIRLLKQNEHRLSHLSEAIDKVASRQRAKSNILFYLPDRKLQKDDLKKAIKAYRAQHSDKKQRPLICLIHGDENEYGNFIKCLLGDFLHNDRALSEYFRNGLFEIELLFEDEFHTVAKLHQEILEFLDNKINVNEKEAIANRLARERRPVVVHARLLTKDLENWQDDERTVVDGFIEFWADWPKNVYAQHQLFLVFLSFSYEGGKNNFSVVNWLRRKKRGKLINSALRSQFETLHEKFPTIKEFFARVLPKLDSIKRKPACNWIKTYEEQIKEFWDDTYALELKVKALYKNRDAIPMEELARELENLLTNPNQ